MQQFTPEPVINTTKIQEKRAALVEARIALRQAQDVEADALTALKAATDYIGLGKNNDARDIALAELIRTDEAYQSAKGALREAEANVDRAEAELADWQDERRLQENRTWAALADYVRTLMNREEPHYAPTQVGRQILKDEGVSAAVDAVFDTATGEIAPENPGDWEQQEEIPF